MTTPAVLLTILLTALILTACLAFNYWRGLCLAALLLVFMPQELALQTPGVLPNLHMSRIIVIVVFCFWLFHRQGNRRVSQVTYLPLLLLFAGTIFISLLFCLNFSNGIKQYLSFTFEILFFYIMVQTSIRDRTRAIELLESVWLGLVLVGIIAVIEKKYGTNLVTYIMPDFEKRYPWDVRSTYPHRILFGVSMAMGFPIAAALFYLKHSGKWKYACSIGLFLTCCYYSASRGPWLGSAAAVGIFFLLGTARERKMILVVCVLALTVLLVRPGVRRTIAGSASDTIESTSFKGQTFRYRLELWKVAFSEISKSPIRLLWGYGPGSTGSLEVAQGEEDEEGNIGRGEYWSWDNHFAWFLLELGFLGLMSSLLLYGAILIRFTRLRSGLDNVDKHAMTGIIASMVVLIFMMTNVMIFGRQLFFLFWMLVAVGNIIVEGQAAPVEVEKRTFNRQMSPWWGQRVTRNRIGLLNYPRRGVQ